MGRRNIISGIDDLELDHDEEYFEDDFVAKKESPLKKEDSDEKPEKDVVDNSEKPSEEVIESEEKKEEQPVIVEKITKSSKKKNVNQESSS